MVGYRDPVDVGAHLERAARSAGIEVAFCDAAASHGRSRALRCWSRARRHRRPPRFSWFEPPRARACRTFRPSLLLATGLAPLGAPALARIRRAGITTAHFLTDDPWNGELGSRWFLTALEHYDLTFTPRKANMDDLAGRCNNVSYLPFAFDPSLHFAESPDGPPGADVVFVGAADERRIRQLRRLLAAGLSVELHGGGWEQHADLRPHAHGYADAATMRRAVAGGKVALGLVRPANRDGHAMRSFELPAMGACVLAERDRGAPRPVRPRGRGRPLLHRRRRARRANPSAGRRRRRTPPARGRGSTPHRGRSAHVRRSPGDDARSRLTRLRVPCRSVPAAACPNSRRRPTSTR